MYAKITRSLEDTGERRHFDSPPPAADDLADTKPVWVPVVVNKVDNSTGTVPVVTTRDVDISLTQMTVTQTRQDMSAGQIDTHDTERVDRHFQVGSSERAIAETLFEVTNWVRVLQGNPEFTAQQFKDYLKSKIR